MAAALASAVAPAASPSFLPLSSLQTPARSPRYNRKPGCPGHPQGDRQGWRTRRAPGTPPPGAGAQAPRYCSCGGGRTGRAPRSPESPSGRWTLAPWSVWVPGGEAGRPARSLCPPPPSAATCPAAVLGSRPGRAAGGPSPVAGRGRAAPSPAPARRSRGRSSRRRRTGRSTGCTARSWCGRAPGPRTVQGAAAGGAGAQGPTGLGTGCACLSAARLPHRLVGGGAGRRGGETPPSRRPGGEGAIVPPSSRPPRPAPRPPRSSPARPSRSEPEEPRQHLPRGTSRRAAGWSGDSWAGDGGFLPISLHLSVTRSDRELAGT